MPISEEQFEEFEKIYKEIVFRKITQLNSALSEVLLEIQALKKYTEFDIEIPNITITINNKLIELANQFKQVGLSMFARKATKENVEFVETSLIGSAIVNDMYSRIGKATEALEEYWSAFETMSVERDKRAQKFLDAGQIKQFFLVVRGLINPTKEVKFSYKQEDLEKLNLSLTEYGKIDQEIWEYNLKYDVITSLVIFLRKLYSQKEEIEEVINEKIVPDLQQLGLESLIPELKRRVLQQEEVTSKKPGELNPSQTAQIQQSAKQTAEKHRKEMDFGSTVTQNDFGGSSR